MSLLKIRKQIFTFTGVRPSLSIPSLPAMVPNFTGRGSECDEITSYVTSESTRLVSIWGSPGFGKTSVAIAVGHDLQSKGMPVCWLSLHELKSKTDLTSKLLSFVKPSVRNDHPSFSHPSLDDQLCLLLSEISHRSIFILDNADNLLEDGVPGVKKEVIGLLKEMLRGSKATIFALTTRESLGFLNVDLQGHESVRIRPLDEDSAKTLVKALLPTATPSDCTRILQICGFVPFAIKLLCSSISEGEAQPSQYLDEFMQFASTASIAEMLDRPDYPDEYRLQSLFELSFKRLTAQEKKALVSLSILPENFGTEVAAAVLDESNFQAKKSLLSLRRKSLIDSGEKQESFTMHKLLQSFAREKGENEMKDTILKSKDRLNAFYVSRFQKLNEQFLTGHSMTAFLQFYEDERSIIQSLLYTLADAKTAGTVFDVLARGELFLDTLFLKEGSTFYLIYDSAIEAAKRFERTESYSRLVVSKAFGEAYWGAKGSTVQLLCRAKDAEASQPPISMSELQGKRLCYLGLTHLVNGNTEDGIRNLKDALQMLSGSPDQKNLTLLTLQILAMFCRFQNTSTELNELLCNASGDKDQLLVLSLKQGEGRWKLSNLAENQRGVIGVSDHPLKLAMINIVSHTTQNFIDGDTKQCLTNILHEMLNEIEREEHISTGVCKFHWLLLSVLAQMEDTTLQCQMRISFHQKALDGCCENNTFYRLHNEALAACYEVLGNTQHSTGDFKAALASKQRALDIRLKLLGEEHAVTADCYHGLGTTQHSLGNFNAALDSRQHALDICLKLFGEEHAVTAKSYHNLGTTQHSLGNFNAALDSKKHALDIRLKLFGEDHSATADSYLTLGTTQHLLENFNAALDSSQHALDIHLKLFGEEHTVTADSYHNLGITQHSLGNFNAALDSTQHALDIRLKLFGEEHAVTANSYHNLCTTQHSLGNFNAALDSTQHALDIRLKLFGEEHAVTADSYHGLGATQHLLGNFNAALDSQKHALDTRLKLFGEEHASTADSCHGLGITQHSLGNFNTALDSTQHALDIRLKLFGEEHAVTADSYYGLGIIQHSLGNFNAALDSSQHALDIRLKLFGEEHAVTADSYHILGIIQHSLGNFKAAIDSKQHALGIRLKLFGENHARTAVSYHNLGTTQHSLGNFKAALDSKQHALGIRLTLFGENHASTADSYHNLGTTQHSLGNFNAALDSKQHALNIRLKLFGENHASTADSYLSLNMTQLSLGDINAALDSFRHALESTLICLEKKT